MTSTDVFVADGVRTPIGRYGGALAKVRPDDLAATVVRSVVARHGGALSADELEGLLDPGGYLGASATFIDRALQAHRHAM